MKNLVTCGILVVLASISVAGQIIDDRFRSPWKNQDRALVIDGNSNNDIDWEKIRTDNRVAGMIFRSGPVKNATTKKWELKPDRGYEPYRKKAKALGYLWGSFYIGISSVGPRTQARFYLDNAKPTDDEVMALDLEDISKEEYMNLDQAVIFINYIKNATGRYPIVYVTGSVHDAIFNKFGKNSVFSKVPLWYARNTDEITPYFAISPWQTYTLWQFSSEINCCKTVRGKTVCDPPTSCCPFGIDPSVPKISGINIDMDVNVFYGTKEELRKAWPFTFKDNR